MLTSVPVILLCAQQLFRAASNVFWFSWCPTYLQEVHKLDKQSAGELTSLPIIGVVIGSILGGLIADRLYRRTGSRRISRAGTAVGATFVGVVLFVATYFVPEGQVALAIFVLSLAAMVVSGGNSCSYSTAMDPAAATRDRAAREHVRQPGRDVLAPWARWKGLVRLTRWCCWSAGRISRMLCWLPLNPDRGASGVTFSVSADGTHAKRGCVFADIYRDTLRFPSFSIHVNGRSTSTGLPKSFAEDVLKDRAVDLLDLDHRVACHDLRILPWFGSTQLALGFATRSCQERWRHRWRELTLFLQADVRAADWWRRSL